MARGEWTESTKRTKAAYDAIDVFIKANADAKGRAQTVRTSAAERADQLQADLDAGIVRIKAPAYRETGRFYPATYPAVYPAGHEKAGQAHPRAGQPRQNAGAPIKERSYIYADTYPDVYPKGHEKAGEAHPKAGQKHPKAGQPARRGAIGAKGEMIDDQREMRPSERMQAKMKIRSLRNAKPKTDTFEAKRTACVDGVRWLRENLGDDLQVSDLFDIGIDAEILIDAGFPADRVNAYAALRNGDAEE